MKNAVLECCNIPEDGIPRKILGFHGGDYEKCRPGMLRRVALV
jgi:hypothetical protein